MRIIFLLTPNMLATSITLPVEMLRASWAMAKVANTQTPPLDIQFRAESGAQVTTQTGISLAAQPLSEPPDEPAIIFVPALWRDPRRVLAQHPKTIEWLKHASQKQTIAAVGTGVSFLAEAGCLDQQTATTHWHFADQFEKRYPAVQLKRDVFITRSRRLFCTASINALAEVTAFFIKELYGLPVAQTVERNFFHEIRQARTQAELDTSTASTTDETIALAATILNEWAQQGVPAHKKAYYLDDLAQQLGVSKRTLNRRFQMALNTSPMQYLQKRRLAVAEELLKTSNLSIADIADQIGYGDTQLFARHFKKHYNVVPSHYRYTVRNKLFTE